MVFSRTNGIKQYVLLELSFIIRTDLSNNLTLLFCRWQIEAQRGSVTFPGLTSLIADLEVESYSLNSRSCQTFSSAPSYGGFIFHSGCLLLTLFLTILSTPVAGSLSSALLADGHCHVESCWGAGGMRGVTAFFSNPEAGF